MKRKTTWGLIVLDFAVAVGAIVGILLMLDFGTDMFRYYTVNSNILGAVACLTEAVFLLCQKEVPRWVTLFRLASVGCLLLTFLVVVTILAPTSERYFSMFEGAMLYHHLLCPLVAFGAFAFLPQGKPLGKTAALVGLIPTGLYGIPAVILNCLRVWDGPYPFLRVWHQPVWASVLWVIVIFGVDFLLLFGTACLYNHFAKKETKTEETSL